jgi:hypothetical protein
MTLEWRLQAQVGDFYSYFHLKGSSNDASDDEAEQLRKILLEQASYLFILIIYTFKIKTKRSSKHTKSKSNEPVTSKPSIKQTVKLVPPIRPPLSPPGFSSSYVLGIACLLFALF